jgi:hypothetical protein
MKTILSVFLSIFVASSFGQVEIAVSKKNISVYESFFLVIRTESNCQLSNAELKGFELVSEPSVSTQSSSTTINGRTTKSKSITKTYELKCKVGGKYTIGPFKADCNGSAYQTQSIQINVSDTPIKNPDFYTELYCNKESVYPGEPFILVQKLYLRTKVKTQLEQVIPSNESRIQKFDITPINDKGQMENEYKTINGIEFNTAIIRQEICFLNESGDYIIEPYYTSALTGTFFNSNRLEAYSNIIKLKAKKKPNNNLTNDFGLTGDFELKYKLDETTLRAGEALDFTITIKGTGNFQLFNTPQIIVPESFDVFEPESNEKLQINENGFFGEKSYHFTYVPTEIGDFTLPAYSISYFDLKSKSFKTLSVPEQIITVEKGENGYGEIIHESKVDTTGNQLILSGLHNSDNTIIRKDELLAGTVLHYILLLLPFGIIWLLLKLKKNKNSISDDQKINRKKKKAKKGSKQHLASCKQLHKNNQDKEALNALDIGLKTFLKNKFNLTENDLTLDNVHEKIENQPTKSKFISCWNTIELYKYSPITANAINDLIEQTEELINEIDTQL